MIMERFLLFAQFDPDFGGAPTGDVQIDGTVAIVFLAAYLAIIVLTIAGIWATFAKAGEPGWAAIIPIYNIIVLLKVAGRPIWWIILFFIPIISLVALIIIGIDLAKNFGKGMGFGLGLAFLPFIFYPILGFGDAQYAKESSDSDFE